MILRLLSISMLFTLTTQASVDLENTDITTVGDHSLAQQKSMPTSDQALSQDLPTGEVQAIDTLPIPSHAADLPVDVLREIFKNYLP